MARDSRLRDPRVETIDPDAPSSNAYLHRAARVAVLLAIPMLTHAHALPQIRSSPRRSGVSIERLAPRQASSRKDFAWRAAAPEGVSSPIVVGGRVFVTGRQDGKLTLIGIDAASGKELWRRQPRGSSTEKLHPRHRSATPAPASDGDSIFVFFPEIGLLAYSLDGDELWRKPLGPFTSVQGKASPTVCADGRVVLLADQTVDAFVAAFDAQSGKELWRRSRPPSFLGGSSTPLIHRPAKGPAQVIAVGGMQIASYHLDTGELLWSNQGALAPAGSSSLGDGIVEYAERATALAGFDGYVGLRAVKIDGAGAVQWRAEQGTPSLPSASLHQGVVLAANEQGVVTMLNADTGELIGQRRLREALGDDSASSIAGDGKVYFVNWEGELTIVIPGNDRETQSVADLGESIQAAPALAGGRLYVCTDSAIYCFGSPT